MKKRIIASILSSMLLLAGCGGNTENNALTVTGENLTTKEDLSTEKKSEQTTQLLNSEKKEEQTTQVIKTDNKNVLNNKVNSFLKAEASDRLGMEKLTDRALIAIDLSGNKSANINITSEDENGKAYTKGVYLSWRSMYGDDENTSFTVYKNDKVIAENVKLTNYIDKDGKYGDIYKIIGSNDVKLGLKQIDTQVWENYSQEFILNPPPAQQLPTETVEFTASDMSLADLDNDGNYELVVKWKPDNAKDNAQKGITGYTYLDGYDIDFSTGETTQLWRIDLGPNIRSGDHYTQYMVWDMDNDGIAEIACKTADGSTSYKAVNGELIETGYVGACNSSAINSAVIGEHPNDYRAGTEAGRPGYIMNGHEYLTIFKGSTGEIIDTVDYYPQREDTSGLDITWGENVDKTQFAPQEVDINSLDTVWGDKNGNRVDRFLACVAYLDGKNPSMVFCRGYYTRVTMAAYRLIDNKLVQQWTFDSNKQEGKDGSKQGNHNISVADVDNDGKDEIIYGSLVLESDGTIKYNTKLGHGDKMDVADIIPSRKGLEIFSVLEEKDVKYQFVLRDAETGEILFGLTPRIDVGGGMAADIDPRYEGDEMWSGSIDASIYSSASTFEEPIYVYKAFSDSDKNGAKKLSDNAFTMYWDGDLLREAQYNSKHKDENGNSYYHLCILDWNYESQSTNTLFDSPFIGKSKEKMGMVADVIGDWREEIISADAEDRSKIRIYMSTIFTDYVVPCLMQDEMYRLGIAWQNVAYNLTPHMSYSLTDGLKTSVVTVEGAIEEKANSYILSGADEIKLNFTQASDGKYGYEVEGYEVYKNSGVGAFSKIATLDANTFTYVDKDVLSADGSVYKYKVAAIVKGKTSYYSLPITVKTGAEAAKSIIKSVEIAVSKKTYNIGENLDKSSVKVTATFGDGTERILNEDEFEIEGFDSSKEISNQTVKVKAGNITKEFEISIISKSVVFEYDGESAKAAPKDLTNVEFQEEKQGKAGALKITSKTEPVTIPFEKITDKAVFELEMAPYTKSVQSVVFKNSEGKVLFTICNDTTNFTHNEILGKDQYNSAMYFAKEQKGEKIAVIKEEFDANVWVNLKVEFDFSNSETLKYKISTSKMGKYIDDENAWEELGTISEEVMVKAGYANGTVTSDIKVFDLSSIEIYDTNGGRWIGDICLSK